MARAAETSKEQIKAMSIKEQSNLNNSVDQVRYNNSQETKPRQRTEYKSDKCAFCGSFLSVRTCPAFGKACNYCKKTGHFERVCRKKQRDCGGDIVGIWKYWRNVRSLQKPHWTHIDTKVTAPLDRRYFWKWMGCSNWLIDWSLSSMERFLYPW